jgi:hypothetical protein
MVTPTGGDKDIDAPKLLNATIIESSKNEFSKTIISRLLQKKQLKRK